MLEFLRERFGDVSDGIRLTECGIWHATPLDVLAAVVAVMKRERLVENGADILDLGAGDGRVVAALKLGFPSSRVIGIELDAELVEDARKRLAGIGAEVTLGNYFAYGPWPAITLHYPDGNEREVLRFFDANALAGDRLLVLSPETAPNLGIDPAQRFKVPAGDVSWSLNVYARS